MGRGGLETGCCGGERGRRGAQSPFPGDGIARNQKGFFWYEGRTTRLDLFNSKSLQ